VQPLAIPVKPLSDRRLRNGHAIARNLHDCERLRASLPKARQHEVRRSGTTNSLGPFQRIIMDFLILMAGTSPGIGASGEPGKTQVNFVDA
jgi:hypothetical protein